MVDRAGRPRHCGRVVAQALLIENSHNRCEIIRAACGSEFPPAMRNPLVAASAALASQPAPGGTKLLSAFAWKAEGFAAAPNYNLLKYCYQ
jgi:hypothetical protein